MLDIKICKDCYISASQFEFAADYSSSSMIRKKVAELKKTHPDQVINLCGNKSALSAVFLLSGKCFLTTTKLDTIHDRLNETYTSGKKGKT